MNKIIGISGKSSSGKSYISLFLSSKLNATYVAVDLLSHEVLNLKETISFLKKEFGEEIFENNVLNRKKLGEIVFNNKQQLEKLNMFCQSQIENKIDKIISTAKGCVILDYALLPWLKQFKDCFIKILIEAPKRIRIERATKKENITKEYFLQRDKNLKPYNKRNFDIIFNNNGKNDIETFVNMLSQKIRSYND